MSISRERLAPILAAMTHHARESGRALDRASLHLEEAQGRTTTPDERRPWWGGQKLTDPEHARAPRRR